MEQLLPVNLPEELFNMLVRASNDAISITDKEGLRAVTKTQVMLAKRLAMRHKES